MEDYKQGMGLRIKDKRKNLKLTQEEIAEMLDISVKHFSEVERGLTGLSIENLIKLSNILGVSIDYIVKGEAEKDKWNYIISVMHNIPENKEALVKSAVKTICELAKK
ncbi:helix-turn-helix domain-containing protein [Eubacterium sp.]|uniref:helix-turn-helix domain-containing protein n=1 Tax=Eubacterium sp. TaxID=142586 RepID=UPI003F01DE51